MALPEADVPRRVDPLALDHYLCYGYIPAPRTILEGTSKLPPAHYAVWHDGALAIERLLGPRLERSSASGPSRRTSSSSARRWTMPCASR